MNHMLTEKGILRCCGDSALYDTEVSGKVKGSLIKNSLAFLMYSWDFVCLFVFNLQSKGCLFLEETLYQMFHLHRYLVV